MDDLNKIVILGAGLSGLSCSYHLDITNVSFMKKMIIFLDMLIATKKTALLGMRVHIFHLQSPNMSENYLKNLLKFLNLMLNLGIILGGTSLTILLRIIFIRYRRTEIRNIK